jgi:hypothetical protein
MGAKLVEENGPKSRIIKMSEMKPLQFGRLVHSSPINRHLVMRTASSSLFEVINLTIMRPNQCWTMLPGQCTDPNNLEVELAENGEIFKFEIIGQ